MSLEDSPTGGDSLTQDLNERYNAGDMAWVITATALVLLMIPGVGFFYSGLARRKSALSLIWLSMMAVGVTSFQWFFWGFSLAFSHTAGTFIGDLQNIGFRNVLAHESVGSDRIPDLLFAVYQGMFAAITVALAVGAVAERGRMLPCVLFMVVWSTVIYDPIACWTWNPSGWVYKLGGLDFAGGTPVHITSGSAALAYSLMLGKRRGHGTQELNFRPHNVTQVIIGTVFLWVGWFGFNAGSALSANLRAVMAAVVTNLAASVGGVTWCLLDYRLERKWSAVGFCSGVVAGLVAITPGSGYVPAWSAVVYGVVGGAACNYATKVKFLLGIDDALDIFAVHAIGGLVGNLLTGFFAADYIAHLDGFTEIDGGWLNQHWIQLAKQLADSVAGFAYSFGGTCLILFLMNLIPGLRLRASEEAEVLGMDDAEIGEFAYDYVELTRDVLNGDALDEAGSKYSGGRGSPMESPEKTFSSADDDSRGIPTLLVARSSFAKNLHRTKAAGIIPAQPQSGFPQTPDEFDSDPRVSFSKLDNKFILEVDEEHEYEYDDALKRWIPVLDSALLEKQGEAYAVQGVDESQPAKPVHKKRKQAYTNGEDEEGGRATNSKKSKPSAEPRERKNTAIYVTSLPLDVTVQEAHDVFSRCGVIAEEIDKGKPRIKLYTDENDNFKGDALIVYFRAESVDLAIQMLDDTDFRLGQPGPNGKMKVAAADFSFKVQKDAPIKSNSKDKKKIIKKTQKLNNKLADWDDDDPSTIADTSSKWDKVVILKHLFTLAELEEDPAAMLEIKEDIRDECAKVGTVTNVVLYDQETDGVASVRYSTVEAANACVRVMDGRFFANKRVEAYIADGNEKFKKSSERKGAAIVDFEIETATGAGDAAADAAAAEEGRRLDRFGEWLEGGEGGG